MLRTPAKNEKDGQRFLAEFILSTVEGLEMTKWNMGVISNGRERSFFAPSFRRRREEHDVSNEIFLFSFFVFASLLKRGWAERYEFLDRHPRMS